jgi:hypothetical protein
MIRVSFGDRQWIVDDDHPLQVILDEIKATSESTAENPVHVIGSHSGRGTVYQIRGDWQGTKQKGPKWEW